MTKEEAINRMKKRLHEGKDGNHDDIYMAIEALKAEPIKHGNWEVVIVYDPKRSFLCPNCRKMAYEPSTYCPGCGAKMDEVKE